MLGILPVDIWLKLHHVHFAVKFSSALALENLTAKCTLCSFNSSPPKSVFKSASLAALDSADLKMDLAGLEPELVKSPSLHSVT